MPADANVCGLKILFSALQNIWKVSATAAYYTIPSLSRHQNEWRVIHTLIVGRRRYYPWIRPRKSKRRNDDFCRNDRKPTAFRRTIRLGIFPVPPCELYRALPPACYTSAEYEC